MVVQKNWNTNEALQQNSESESSTTTFTFQFPRTVNVRTSSANTMQTKQPISRQIAINTLAAMHRRFSLPGPVQPHSRPIAEFRASANKSLDTLRQTIQSAVTREIDQVIRKYLEKFFVPAVKNIRLNLGGDSVSEDQVKAVCRAMLDAARLLYAPQKTSQTEGNDGGSCIDSKFGIKQEVQSSTNKRKETDSEIDFSIKRKKIKEEIPDGVTPPPTPSPALRDPDKWDPARLTSDTLFIMGSHAHKGDGRNAEYVLRKNTEQSIRCVNKMFCCEHNAHKVLGLGNARGRLYTRHAGLLRYPADTSDKEWIAGHNLVNAVGGKTYIMVLEDIEELAKSEAYKHTSLPMLGELTGFKAPQFMLRKIKAYIVKRNLGEAGNDSPQPSTSNTQVVEPYQLDNIKIEQQDFDTDNFNASQYNIGTSDNTKDFSDVPTDTDLCDIKVEDIDDIKVDGIKVEDLDEMKVDGIKVDDLVAGVDVKIESMDDIDGIKVEDIKLEHDDFSLCKQSDDDQNLDGLLDADIEFLSRNLENIESDADARKAIENLTGANPDTLTLVGDEFDLGPTLNSNNFTTKETKCITVQSSSSGMVHSVPVAHIAPRRITGSTVHYYTSPSVQPNGQRSVHLPQATVTIQSIPSSTSQVIRGIPLNTKTGAFSTVMSQGTASTIIGFGARTSNATIIGTPQYVNVTSKSFPTGNILHNAIVSRNIINRTNSAMSFNLSTMKPVQTAPKISTSTADFDGISTTKDMIDNACNSSVMLKKVLTLGSTGTKSFMMQNTQKVLSTGFATGSAPPPNVTIVSSGTSVGILNSGHTANLVNTSGTLSATHATLSALLSSGDILPTKKN